MREKRERHKNRGIGGVFIPAFLFIGLGIGLLFDMIATGALVGLGAGFIAMAIVRSFRSTGSGVTSIVPELITIFLGILFIIAGIGIIYFPVMIWPYLGAAVLIFLGLWFLLRGYRAFSSGNEEKEPDNEKE